MERNEKQKLGIYLIIATLGVQIGKMFFDNFSVYELMVGLMYGVMTYIFYKIFSNSVVVVKEYGKKQVFSIEEVMGASLLLTIAFVSLSSLKVLGLSITKILSVMLVLLLGWKNGVLTGATGGITIGMVLGLITKSDPVLISSFAVSRHACRVTQ